MATPNFFSPRYWPVWLLIGFLTLCARLSDTNQRRLAKLLAGFMSLLARRRRHIIDVNLRLCFPEWDDDQRKRQLNDILYQNALGLIETANAYHRPVESFRASVTVTGLDVLQQAQAQEKGVLLLGAHYSHLDFGGALVSLFCSPYAIYRPNNNPLMDRYILEGRARFMKGVIERSDMRGIIRALKRNEVVWYPPDQDYGRDHSVFAPFFGINAATITATSRLVKFNQSPVVMLSCYRDDDTGKYQLEFSAAPEGFPSGDEVTDATLINRELERCIRKAPTQYMWMHRRFKTQPDGRAKLYR